MLNQIKLSGRVKVRKSTPVTKDDGTALTSVLVNVVTEQNGQGVQYVSANYISSNNEPFNDGKFYDVIGYMRTWSKGEGKSKTYGQNIQIKSFTEVSESDLVGRKNKLEEYAAQIASGSVE